MMVVKTTLLLICGLMCLSAEGKKYLAETKTAQKAPKQEDGVRRAIDPDLSDETDLDLPHGINYPDTDIPATTPPPVEEVCDAGLGKKDCCSPRHRCSAGQGDCDTDADCQRGLTCHNDLNNCRQFNPFAHAEADCCVKRDRRWENFNDIFNFRANSGGSLHGILPG